MANTPAPNSRPTPEKIEAVRDLLRKLKEQAREADQAGDAFMLGVFKDLVKRVSPIATRAIARLEREENAAINKAHKKMLKAEREAQKTAQQQQQASEQ